MLDISPHRSYSKATEERDMGKGTGQTAENPQAPAWHLLQRPRAGASHRPGCSRVQRVHSPMEVPQPDLQGFLTSCRGSSALKKLLSSKEVPHHSRASSALKRLLIAAEVP